MINERALLSALKDEWKGAGYGISPCQWQWESGRVP